jgi:hypothetical protein
MWILVLTIVSFNSEFNSVSSQSIPMDELHCRHYEAFYNSGKANRTINGYQDQVIYRAHCLQTNTENPESKKK